MTVENELGLEESPALNDKVRLVTNEGQSRQTTIEDLKHLIEDEPSFNFGNLDELDYPEPNDYYLIYDTSTDLNKKVKAINSEERIGVHGYISTPAATTITDADTYYTLEGTFTNPILDNFTITASGIRYDGVYDVLVEITLATSIMSNTNNATITLGLSNNGVPCVCAMQLTKLGLAGTYQTLSSVDAVTLSTNDTISIIIKSDKAASTVTATTLTTSLRKFY